MKQKESTLTKIIKEVSFVFDVPASSLFSKNKSREVMLATHTARTLIRNRVSVKKRLVYVMNGKVYERVVLRRATTTFVGNFFGCGHSQITNSERVVNDMCETDKDFRRKYNIVKQRLNVSGITEVEKKDIVLQGQQKYLIRYKSM